MDPNLEYENLLSAYKEATFKYIPVKGVQVSQFILNNPKWFNKSIKKLTSLKYKLHCRLRATPNNNELQLQYKNQCVYMLADLANIYTRQNDGENLERCFAQAPHESRTNRT